MISAHENPLVNLSAHISFLKMPTNIGFIKVQNCEGTEDIYLVDSGNDDASGAKILDFIKSSFPDANVKAVLNTHAHADHCGGNSAIKKAANCEIWASKESAALMEYPELETQLIWGGTPISDIKSRFLLARPCRVDKIFNGEKIKIPVFESKNHNSKEKNEDFQKCKTDSNSLTLEIIPLPGHYIGQTGFLFTDTDGEKIFFGGDAFSGKSAIKKFWIQYLLNETQTKETLRAIEKINADFYVPGHGETVREIEGIAELNLIAILETENMILDELKKPKTLEEILKAVAERNSIPLKISQICLIGSTLRSYLSGLYESKKISYEIKDGRLLWKKI